MATGLNKKAGRELNQGIAPEPHKFAYAMQYLYNLEDPFSKAYGEIYTDLTVLDRKTSGQLTFSSLMIVIYILLLVDVPGLQNIAILIGLVLELYAVILAVEAIYVNWFPLERKVQDAFKTEYDKHLFYRKTISAGKMRNYISRVMVDAPHHRVFTISLTLRKISRTLNI